MKRTAFTIGCLIFAILGIASCGKDEKAKPTGSKNLSSTAISPGGPLTVAYVDLDSVLSHYLLAIDFNEQMIAKQSSYETEARNQYNAIQKQEEAMTKKMNSNQYTSEEAFKSDQVYYQNLQKTAETKLTNLQNSIQQAALEAQKTVNDSIQNFIQEYNRQKGYSVILFKEATLFIDPSLDITDEVIEGLNARYNKIKK